MAVLSLLLPALVLWLTANYVSPCKVRQLQLYPHIHQAIRTTTFLLHAGPAGADIVMRLGGGILLVVYDEAKAALDAGDGAAQGGMPPAGALR
eukprot:355368-Chlamydomonas_euryale.AAC.14